MSGINLGDSNSDLSEENSCREDAEYIGGIIRRVSNFRMDSFEGRKIFQKTVYLIQAFDIDLGYSFNWHLHGVYSPELAKVGYELSEIYGEVSESVFTDSATEERFQEFLRFIEPLKNDVERLEISSSLYFLNERNSELDKDILIQFLLEEKNLESGVEGCEEEWERLVDYGLV